MSGKYLPCPYGDKGKCYLPDVAVAISEGRLSLVQGRARDRLAGQISAEAKLQKLDFDLREAIAAAISRLPGVTDIHVEMEPTTEDRGQRRRGADLPSGEWVLVQCQPCGHYFKVAVEGV